MLFNFTKLIDDQLFNYDMIANRVIRISRGIFVIQNAIFE